MDGDFKATDKTGEFARVRGLQTPSLYPWVRDLAIDWSLIAGAATAACLTHQLLAVLVAMLVIGNRQHALAVLGHEGTHYTLSRNVRLNDALTNLFCFWPLLMTVTGYRLLHFRHHKLTGTHDDPELLHKKMRAPQWDLPLKPAKVLRYMFIDLLGGSIHDLWIILKFSIPQDRRLFYPVVLLHTLFVTGSLLTDLWLLPVVWYGALATSFMMFFRVRLWLEHQGTFDTQRVAVPGLMAAIFAPHNIWLHWEHHRFPGIPYHRLSEARRLLGGPQTLSARELMAHLRSAPDTPSGNSRNGLTGNA